MKRIVSILVVALFMLQIAAFAESNSTGIETGALTSVPTEGTASIHELYGGTSISEYSLLQNFAFITSMTAGITNHSDGTVTINGSTYANQKVATLSVGVQLQRWDGSAWVNESPTYLNTASSDYMVFGYQTLTITKGYYYRTKSYHSAKNGFIEESAYHYSDYIYIAK